MKSADRMSRIRTILTTSMLLACVSGEAMGYQYAGYQNGYYPPPPPRYAVPRAYNPPYARAPYAYYPGYRYPVRPVYVQPQEQQPVPSVAVEKQPIETPLQQLARPAVANTATAEEDAAASRTVENNSLSERKQAFINTLLPHIEKENRRLAVMRSKLADMFARIDKGAGLSAAEQQHISKLAKKYRVNGKPLQQKAARDELLRKLDIIPTSLALAQAANESAWGESRFAREANNLFGIWTYDKDKGLKPRKREQGKKHLVRIFEDVGESVRYYMYTLNSHPAYAELREIRWQSRVSAKPVHGYELAAGLEKYSAKGQAYIDLIQGLIRQNEWALLDGRDQRA